MSNQKRVFLCVSSPRVKILTASAACAEAVTEKQQAEKPQRENIVRQLSKLGTTPFECAGIKFEPEPFNFFIPSSTLAELRRTAADKLVGELRSQLPRSRRHDVGQSSQKPPRYPEQFSYQYNIANKLARRFYEKEQPDAPQPAFELKQPEEALIMQCRHCIRYSLGHCAKHGGKPSAWREPLYLRMDDGRRFRLQFDCNKCQMNIFAE